MHADVAADLGAYLETECRPSRETSIVRLQRGGDGWVVAVFSVDPTPDFASVVVYEHPRGGYVIRDLFYSDRPLSWVETAQGVVIFLNQR